jgi:hypothetical protein
MHRLRNLHVDKRGGFKYLSLRAARRMSNAYAAVSRPVTIWFSILFSMVSRKLEWSSNDNAA